MLRCLPLHPSPSLLSFLSFLQFCLRLGMRATCGPSVHACPPLPPPSSNPLPQSLNDRPSVCPRLPPPPGPCLGTRGHLYRRGFRSESHEISYLLRFSGTMSLPRFALSPDDPAGGSTSGRVPSTFLFVVFETFRWHMIRRCLMEGVYFFCGHCGLKLWLERCVCQRSTTRCFERYSARAAGLYTSAGGGLLL